MPDSKISALPSATVPLAGTEVLPIVQSGTTDKVTAADILRQNGQTVTTSNPVLSLAQTWNAGGVAFTGMQLAITDTASSGSSLLALMTVGGSNKFRIDKDGTVDSYSAFRVLNNAGFISIGTGVDTYIYRDAANTLALRNAANAQAFRVYNTTDGTNLERLEMFWSGNTGYLRTVNSGTGSARSLYLGTFGAANLGFQTNNVLRWFVDTTGHLLAAVDNTYDIGASGATRPRSIYVGSNVVVGTQIQAGSFITAGNGSYIGITSSFFMDSASSGVVAIKNWAGTDFSRLQFGGTTSSFPALARSGTVIQARLADNSSLSPFECSNLDATSGNVRAGGSVLAHFATAIPAGGTAGAGLRVSSTSNFGVFFGSGAPTLSAAKGSLYLRSDGSTTNDRCYVNTDGSTTWTAVTTAA